MGNNKEEVISELYLKDILCWLSIGLAPVLEGDLNFFNAGDIVEKIQVTRESGTGVLDVTVYLKNGTDSYQQRLVYSGPFILLFCREEVNTW